MRTGFVAVVGLYATTAFAVPLQLPHQGRLLDTQGAPVVGSHALTVTLHDLASGGSTIWTETQTVAFTDGYYNVQLGAITPLTTTLLDGSVRYLQLQLDSSAPMAPRTPLLAVPYAVRAEVAGSVQAGSTTVIANDGYVTPVAAFEQYNDATGTGGTYNVAWAGDVRASTPFVTKQGDSATFRLDRAGWYRVNVRFLVGGCTHTSTTYRVYGLSNGSPAHHLDRWSYLQASNDGFYYVDSEFLIQSNGTTTTGVQVTSDAGSTTTIYTSSTYESLTLTYLGQ